MCSFEINKYLGIVTVVLTNMRAIVFISNMMFFILNFILDNANAAIVLINILKNMTATVTTTLLKMYLEIGMPFSVVVLNRFLKFSNVGFCGKNVGGNAKSSSKGLNECEKINIIGRIMKIASGINIM